MDSVINRLRNTVTTVTSTVQQLSVVLPGNPVTREYEINQPQIASAGPGLLWKIYSGYKKSTKQEASIFIFEKKQLDKWNRKDRDAMIEILKKGVQQLTKLKHPRILTVQYALEESRDSLAFASEPIVASLANVLDVNGSSSYDGVNMSKKYELHEMEIKHGLLQICEGLTFLHRDARILHGNICPESVIISEQGSWKVFGLDFCNPATSTGATGTDGPTWACREYEMDGQELAQANLDYMAPEYSNSNTCSPASDMFSLGLLAYTAFNKGHKLIHCNGNWHKHKQYLIRFETLTENDLKCIPTEMRYFERRLLNSDPTQRPDSHEFSKLECLRDEGVRTLIFLDSMFQMDNLQKSKFYKGLNEILPKLLQRIRVQRVVPSLAQEFVNPTMVPFVLPNVLRIAEWSTNDEYVRYVLPHLRVVLKLREPVQILFIFMKHMELLLQKTPSDITKSDVLPLIYDSLESDSTQVQELCLSIIPSFAALIDFPAMKNSLLPRIKKLCLYTQSLSVRVNCLVCLGKILDHLDKWLVIDMVLPFLTEIPSREPAVVMGIVGILKLAATHKKLGLTREIIAVRVLPFLFPLTIENGLTLQQFSTIMSFVYELIKVVETEQKSKLEELGAIAREQGKSEFSTSNAGGSTSQNSGGTSTELDDFFSEMSPEPSKSTTMHKSISTGFSSSQPSKQSMSSTLTPSPLPGPPTMAQSQSSNSLSTSMKTTKDLTSTLINSNLNQMSMQQRPTIPVQTTPQFSMQQQQQQWPSPQAQTYNPNQQQMQMRFPVLGTATTTTMPTSFSMNNMALNGNWSSTTGSTPNYTAFSSPATNPMGMGGMSPRMNGTTTSSNSGQQKVLSKQEIDDFLNFK